MFFAIGHVKGKRVGVCKVQYISRLCVFALKNRGMKNVIFFASWEQVQRHDFESDRTI